MCNEDKIPEVTHELPLHPPATKQQRDTQECVQESYNWWEVLRKAYHFNNIKHLAYWRIIIP